VIKADSNTENDHFLVDLAELVTSNEVELVGSLKSFGCNEYNTKTISFVTESTCGQALAFYFTSSNDPNNWWMHATKYHVLGNKMVLSKAFKFSLWGTAISMQKGEDGYQ